MGFLNFMGLLLTWSLMALRVLARVVRFLIVKMGMWLPALFVLGYLVICPISGIALGDPQAVRVLWIGAVVCAAIGLVVTNIWMEYRRRKKKFGTFMPQWPKRHNRKESDVTDTEISDPPVSGRKEDAESDYARGYRDAMRDFQIEGGRFERGKEPEPKKAQEESVAPLSAKYAPDAVHPEQKRSGFDSVPDRFSQARRGTAGTPFKQTEAEEPLVFATRKNPDILVVEYSDRLVYFRKDPKGGAPQFITCEYKTGY